MFDSSVHHCSGLLRFIQIEMHKWLSDTLSMCNAMEALASTVFATRFMLTYFIAEAKKLIANLLLLPDDHTGLDIPTI
jgi:hypothetical protein